MADTTLNIHIRALDEFSTTMNTVQSGMNKVQNGLHEAAMSMRSTGREISRIGMEMGMVGAAITAPLILAYKDSAKYSGTITKQINDMSLAYQNVQRSIGQALIPVMDKLIDSLNRMVNAWNSWGKDKQDAFIQALFKIGAGFAAFGLATLIVGRLVVTLGVLFDLISKSLGIFQALAGTMTLFGVANVPILAVVLAVTALVTAMWQLKSVGDSVINTFDIIFSTLMAGFQYILSLVDNLVASLFKLLSLIPGIHDQMKQLRQEWEAASKAQWQGMSSSLGNVGNMMSGNPGNMATSFDGFKVSVNSGLDSLKDFSKQLGDLWDLANNGKAGLNGGGGVGFWDGFGAGLAETQIAMSNWAEAGKTMANSLYTSFSSTFDSMFNDAFQGNLKKASDYFRSWCVQIGQMFSKLISQMIANEMMFGSTTGTGTGGLAGALKNMFGGSSGGVNNTGMSNMEFDTGAGYGEYMHDGGPIQKAHDGLAVGEVPIIAQTGEGVLSRRGMANLAKLNGGQGGGGGVTINITPVIQAWDANDVYRNRQTIVDSITQDIMNNGQMRSVIRRYT